MKNQYVVVWSENNLQSYEKIFDNYYQAEWFAKEMKRWYDYVLCIEENKSEDF